ncbi:glutamate racemase [Ferrimicrobium sp.]|uniref:glutamate racemase n=1 Tax=Ferrimicrobium sp. TaxID=2926050 RepID=UPI00261DFC9A|nr:glutamate racemase [Ferrimicrobium sp.]
MGERPVLSQADAECAGDPPLDQREVIAVFDSGFGGLNILEALRDLLPGEHFVYLGDSKRSPYGDRAPAEVLQFSLEIFAYLRARYRLKLVVVACNTASAIALEALKATSDVPVVGVIDAAVRAMTQATENSRVGVVGTAATIASGVYQRRLAHQAVTAIACPGLVEYVEAGAIDDPALLDRMRTLMRPLRRAGVDTLLLACTHYPYLAAQFRAVLGEGVMLISSGEETAFEVRELLTRAGQVKGRPGVVEPVTFLCTGSVVDFQEVGRRLFTGDLGAVEHVHVDALPQDLLQGDQAPEDQAPEDIAFVSARTLVTNRQEHTSSGHGRPESEKECTSGQAS